MQLVKTYGFHIIAFLTVVVWGTTFVSTKVLLNNGLSASDIFFYRFLLAYLSIWLISPHQLFAKSLKDELILFTAGICGGSLYFLTENVALKYSFTSNVALIVCITPLITLFLSGIFFRKEKMGIKVVIGSIISFLGMVLVVLNGQFVLNLSPIGDLLAFSAALTWSLYSIIIKQIGEQYQTVFLTRKIFFYGLITILPTFIFHPLNRNFQILSHPSVYLNILFLGLVASMVCFVLWNIVIKHLGAVKSSNYIYLNPIVAMITSSIVLQEKITLIAIFGAILILLGMFEVFRK